MAGWEAPINTGAAIHSGFSVPAACEGSQPQPDCATTSTRRDRSWLTTSAGSTCCDTTSAGGDTLSATCTLPDTATPTTVRTPGTRRASNAHTALARDRAKSRNSLTGPEPAPPTHVMLSSTVRVAANAAT